MSNLSINAINAISNIRLEFTKSALFFLFFERDAKFNMDEMRQRGENMK